MEQQQAVNNEETTEGLKAGGERMGTEKFKQWCAVVEMAAQVMGARAIPILAKQGREAFSMSIMYQRDPEPIVELLTRGEIRNTWKGAEATEFMDTLDQLQAQLKSKGLDLPRDDIALATVIRIVACENLGIEI